MNAIDAFYTKQIAYEILHTHMFQFYLQGFYNSVSGNVPGIMGGDTSGYADADDLSKKLARTLDMAETFYIAPTMNQLVTAAAESWAEDEPVFADDFPTSHGWLYIPTGMTTIDVRGQVLTTSAISWAMRPGSNKVDVVWWSNKDFDAPYIKSQEHWKTMAQWSPWHLGHVDLGQPLPMAIGLGAVLPPEVSQQIKWLPVHEDEDGVRNYAMTYPTGYSPEEMAEMMEVKLRQDTVTAWLVSALRIMQQPMVTVTKQGLPANVRKGLRRGKVVVKQKAITVIEFRRRVGEHGHSEREYTHRFLRRGHWRQQPYKRTDGEWDRRRIWIHPTIVGDPSLPLILREHVNALVR